MFGVVLLLLAQSVEPPRGVNDSVLGTAEQFRKKGPARVCLMRTSVDLRRGETSYLDYLGIHHGSIRVVGSHGTINVSEGDAWADPEGGVRVREERNRVILRYGRRPETRYLIHAPSEWSDEVEPVVWVGGTGLDGSRRDLSFLGRVTVSQTDPMGCNQRFSYGWDMLLGE